MADRDPYIEQALIALKKGTRLIKYSRRGRPKFRPFRLSPDETTLIWYSRKQERNLKLAAVSKIIPGQRTPVFKRYRRPEKEYLSFSLIYENGERSLDLICKDNLEVEIWLAGLRHLIFPAQKYTRRAKSDLSDFHDAGSDEGQNGHPFGLALDFTSSIPRGSVSIDSPSPENTNSFVSSDVVFGGANMEVRTSCADSYRISVSNTPSCSTQSSGPDDIESFGDVYLWGKVCCDGTSNDGLANGFPSRRDALTPKLLESNVVIDVQKIACGVRHFALLTKQGDIFTCGEESGGRLGHGVDRDVGRPHLIDFLSVTNVNSVSCGEYHTCAVSSSGDLYTWGDGSHNAGILGHGTDVSHWIPKRVSGPLEGIQVLSVACGNWHSAIITVGRKLFTFGDGTYGALGHGDHESVQFPKEVASLSDLKTLKIVCGLWHTAAIVELKNQKTKHATSKKLFTWGDGDKYRLGHGNKQTCTKPTCVQSLIDHNFHQLGCGHSMTVGLTTSGHVFTMGSPAHGQLGNPQADGKSPCLVQDKLVGEFVEEIACGAYHVACLTSRSEVFTWGKGANGRLGHGDMEDRNTPTLVESFRDRIVRSLSCGANFTACICIHKWASGVDQSVCNGCRQAFGFTRIRHNCYNCGLVHCYGCSSRKALKAALAPTPEKPHRVCDACYVKLMKVAETGNNNVSSLNKGISTQIPMTGKRLDRYGRTSRPLISPITEPVKYHEVKSGKYGSKTDSYSMVPSFQNLKDVAFPSSLSAFQSALKPGTVPPRCPPLPPYQQPQIHASPYPIRPNSSSSGTPIFSRGLIDSFKKSNEVLHKEVARLQNQVKHLKQKSDKQDSDNRKLRNATKQAEAIAAEKTAKCEVAVDVFKCIISQLNELTEKLPPEISEDESFKALADKASDYINTYGSDTSSVVPIVHSDKPEESSSSEVIRKKYHKNEDVDEANKRTDNIAEPDKPTEDVDEDSMPTEYIDEADKPTEDLEDYKPTEDVDEAGETHPNDENVGIAPEENNEPSSSNTMEAASEEDIEDGSQMLKHPKSEELKEVIEQFEPGVYVTLLQLSNGIKLFKRVRFSKRKFNAHQAEEWWKGNKDKLFKRYRPAKPQSTSNVPSAAASPLAQENSEDPPPST
uniref:PH, RCC1 and FYVE domains-containing protein 1-like n=1 Tax=Erigeron canadensis TaxID=72917 RepID=UPI001CB9C062|nr:PH, RCC1 and FYVE domains-containing protein 1-like [Erigeron canadensis]